MADLDTRAAETEKKLKELKAKIAKRDAEKLKAEKAQKLKIAQLRKTLIADFMLEGGDPLLLLNGKGQNFEKWLKLPEHRAVFGLESVQKDTTAKV